jgi:signal transduction histidine kinase
VDRGKSRARDQDFGPGIAPRFQDRVFALFQTLESHEGALFKVRWPKESRVNL